jgi:hypothetical protein
MICVKAPMWARMCRDFDSGAQKMSWNCVTCCSARVAFGLGIDAGFETRRFERIFARFVTLGDIRGRILRNNIVVDQESVVDVYVAVVR